MQAITTKFLPCTYTKPNRIKASCARGSIILSVDSARENSHVVTVQKLIEKFLAEDAKSYGGERGYDAAKNSWAKPFHTGQLPNGDYCHVFNESAPLEKQIVETLCNVTEHLNRKQHNYEIHVRQAINTARVAFGIK